MLRRRHFVKERRLADYVTFARFRQGSLNSVGRGHIHPDLAFLEEVKALRKVALMIDYIALGEPSGVGKSSENYSDILFCVHFITLSIFIELIVS